MVKGKAMNHYSEAGFISASEVLDLFLLIVIRQCFSENLIIGAVISLCFHWYPQGRLSDEKAHSKPTGGWPRCWQAQGWWLEARRLRS